VRSRIDFLGTSNSLLFLGCHADSDLCCDGASDLSLYP
jgi:hypothetical protein